MVTENTEVQTTSVIESEVPLDEESAIEPSGSEPVDPTSFDSLGLSPAALKVLDKIGFQVPSPIQARFIPIAITGRDCIGQARTGTGKTAAFVLPILEQLGEKTPTPQSIILTPTRELSEQVAEEAKRLTYSGQCRIAVLVGGRPIHKQIEQLQKQPQIVVGAPGRVLDLINRRNLDLSRVKVAVLDEADRMLDIGFLPDIKKILNCCPRERQTFLLSATLPGPVERLAHRFMKDPLRIDLSEDKIVVDTIDQFYVTVEPHIKFRLLVELLKKERPHQAIVFTRTRRGAEKLHQRFQGKLSGVSVIHGDLPQRVRDRVLKQFRAGTTRLLIATDVMGRGIDISGISHIINFDLPQDCDDYVHRIGRTGRMTSDTKGRAFSFVAPDEGDQLTKIENRVDSLLTCYSIDGLETFKERRRNHVDDLSNDPKIVVSDDDFGSGVL